jgi:hypothetical protein
MIQRIQTLYLLLAFILLGLMYFLPVADITAADAVYTLDISGVKKAGELVTGGLPLLIFLSAVILVHGVTIFLYKKRLLQVKILILTIILVLGLFSTFFWFAYMGFRGAQVGFKLTIAIPAVVIILDYLAIKAIAKDEALVRSLDRIR